MPSANYPYANGRIRVIESTLLDEQKFQRLQELSFEAALHQLSEWGYAAECVDRDNIDALSNARLNEIHAIIDEVTPQKALTDLFWLSLDAVNLKYFIKSSVWPVTSAGTDDLNRGVYDIPLLSRCADEKKFSLLGDPLATLLSKVDIASGDLSPRALSFLIDRSFYEAIFLILENTPNTFCKCYFSAQADCTNILNALRARQLGWVTDNPAEFFLPGGGIPHKILHALAESEQVDKISASVFAEGSPQFFRSAIVAFKKNGVSAAADFLGETLLQMAKEARFNAFDIGPLAYYTLCGIKECRMLRMLFAQKRIYPPS